MRSQFATARGFQLSNSISEVAKEVPVITFSPAAQEIVSGEQAQLSTSISGTVASFQWSPELLLLGGQSLTPKTTQLSSTTVYNLKAVSLQGCSTNGNAVVKVFTNLYMPTAFTPNGDGNNDVF